MSEETLSDSERLAILQQVIKPKTQPIVEVATADLKDTCECGHQHSGKCTNKYCSCVESKIPTQSATLGSLLEQSLANRVKFDQKINESLDEVKKEILAESNFNIIRNWKF